MHVDVLRGETGSAQVGSAQIGATGERDRCVLRLVVQICQQFELDHGDGAVDWRRLPSPHIFGRG